MNSVMSAIRQGWTISKTATVLAHGSANEGRGFLLTLASPTSDQLREYFVPDSPVLEAMLAREHFLTADTLN